jgi:H/ACA ribonucleoprotein complex subunit 4
MMSFAKPTEILVRKEAKTDSKFGCPPHGRDVGTHLDYGIVVLNKPKGPTSHQVSAYVQKILGLGKSGHSGTLDPKVTGVLPVALGRATRIVQALLPAGKEYVCLMHLHDEVEEKRLREVLKGFVGRIKQLPPVKSAVKRQLRRRSIYYLDVLEVEGKEVLFRVGCQAGTYIRKLCHDIGVKLGTGAHMTELVRTRVGPFDDACMVTLQDLSDAVHYWKEEGSDKYLRHCVRPVEESVSLMFKVWILDSAVEPVCHGTNVAVPGISRVNGGFGAESPVAIMTLKDELVALGTAQISCKKMLGDKGIAVKVQKVFMEPGTYPRIMR